MNGFRIKQFVLLSYLYNIVKLKEIQENEDYYKRKRNF